MKALTFILGLTLAACLFGQGARTAPKAQKPGPATSGTAKLPPAAETAAVASQAADKYRKMREAEQAGIDVRLKDIARFRGVRGNQLLGYGLVVGLEGTGDTRNTPFTQTLLANAMKFVGTVVDPNLLKVKNVAVVAITAELPPFAMPGNTIDVTVQSIGDAKSLQGGTLLQTPLYAAARDTVYAAAQGAVSIGGFNVGSGGNSVQKNHSTVGRIPNGAIVEAMVPTRTVFEGKMYLELEDADMTTAKRIVAAIAASNPDYEAVALTPGTIELSLPQGRSPVEAMSEIELLRVLADIPAIVVINERTGTIVAGGNVRLGPAMIAKGSLNVRIETDYFVSQPAPFSAKGETVVVPQTRVDAEEATAQVAVAAPTATVADLAKLFQALKLSPTDIIAILQALRDQGSLKARIKIQ